MSQESARVIAFLQKKWGNDRRCPMCNADNWIVSEKVFQMQSFNTSPTSADNVVIPIIPVTCSNCGNIVSVNAIMSGAVDINGRPITE